MDEFIKTHFTEDCEYSFIDENKNEIKMTAEDLILKPYIHNANGFHFVSPDKEDIFGLISSVDGSFFCPEGEEFNGAKNIYEFLVLLFEQQRYRKENAHRFRFVGEPEPTFDNFWYGKIKRIEYKNTNGGGIYFHY